MERVQIIREQTNDVQTLGSLVFRGDILCYTLELPWRNNERQISKIPKGVYKVVRRWSKKYQHHFHVTGVQGRDLILIHHGNFFKDTLGCILVGRELLDIDGDGHKDVTASLATMKLLLDVLPKEDFELEIIEQYV
jgi:hypothetical protein